VAATFEDVARHAQQCRFPDCTHTQEPGCAVLAAVASGELSAARHRSYLKPRKETEFHDMSYVERRHKDRAFGRMVKTVKKQSKDQVPSLQGPSLPRPCHRADARSAPAKSCAPRPPVPGSSQDAP
jgi:hypothetical protein